jgi:hypothetical protein
MTKLRVLPGNATSGPQIQPENHLRPRHGLKTADFRRLLSDLKRRPLNEREFLRKLLKRAAAAKASKEFPATNLTIPDHAASP